MDRCLALCFQLIEILLVRMLHDFDVPLSGLLNTFFRTFESYNLTPPIYRYFSRFLRIFLCVLFLKIRQT